MYKYSWLSSEFLYYNYFFSGPYRAQRIADSILGETRLSAFLHNRTIGFSVRAGESGIYTYLPDELDGAVKVLGRRSYIEVFNGGNPRRLPDTTAVDCNLTQWGLEQR